jgi:hypothetical protein
LAHLLFTILGGLIPYKGVMDFLAGKIAFNHPSEGVGHKATRYKSVFYR